MVLLLCSTLGDRIPNLPPKKGQIEFIITTVTAEIWPEKKIIRLWLTVLFAFSCVSMFFAIFANHNHQTQITLK